MGRFRLDVHVWARIPRGRFVAVLGLALGVVVLWSRIGAHDPRTWLVENALVPGLLLILAATYRRLPLSRFSYFLMFAFLVLHEVGAHYTGVCGHLALCAPSLPAPHAPCQTVVES